MIRVMVAKYRLLTIGLLLIVSGLLLTLHFRFPNVDSSFSSFQVDFRAKEKKLRVHVKDFLNTIQESDLKSEIWDKTRSFRRSDFQYFLYRRDSLVNWTSNTVPLIEPEQLEQSSGAILLQNGWYYYVKSTQKSFTTIGVFLIKSEYPYENENLRNEFHPAFYFPFDVRFTSIQEDFPLIDSQGNFVLSLSAASPLPVAELTQILLVAMLVIGFMCVFVWVVNYLLSENVHKGFLVLFFLLLFVARWWTLKYNWSEFFVDFSLFNPQVYGASILFPTLGDLLINTLLLWLLVYGATEHLNVREGRPTSNWLSRVLIILFFGVSLGVSRLLHSLVADSDIPLFVWRLFELSSYSYLTLIILGIILWSYFLLARMVVQITLQSTLSAPSIWVICFFSWIGYVALELFLNQAIFVSLLFPFLLGALLFWIESRPNQKYSFSQVVVLLLLFSGVSVLYLDSSLWMKEMQSREVYAKKLISDKDLDTEIEYAQLEQVIESHPLLRQSVQNPEEASMQEVQHVLQTNVFSDHWERFEMDFFLFTADSLPIGTQLYTQENSFFYLDQVIRKHAERSDFSEHLFYVVDYTDKLSYVIHQPVIQNDSIIGYFLATLKSKIIPQEIGFPRLLLHDDSKVVFPLENYSMAKYVNENLVSRHGAFNYPLMLGSFFNETGTKQGFVNSDETSHYILRGEFGRTLVLSKPVDSASQKLTGFSFLFTVFGIFLLGILFIQRRLFPDLRKLKLAVRIQLILISLVFFALLFFSLGTGTFVKDQYDEYRDGLVREKLSSVQMELVQKLGFEGELKRARMANYLEYLLQKFSLVFMTDINLYDLQGRLLASSRPEVYELGLISEYINPRAFRQMSYKKRSMYIHEEMIGNLRYLSAYVPLQNNQDEVIAYMNLPYFAKQNEFENEIASFLSAIINVFLLLLALSVVVSVVVTNRITDPLKRIQTSLAGLELGKANTPIDYKGNDEIAALVKEYNAKLSELDEKAQELARSERELAWREMAKQVAHEIKNPLTPMKLRLQHLQRSFNPDDPNATQRLNQVANSIIEQIDTLTHIANEFSNFAKLPRPNEEKLNIVAIIRSVYEMFKETENCSFRLDLPSNEVWVMADKDLMIRVFNNLIKNAVQAIPADRQGQITIQMQSENAEVCIRVKDNGVGIPEELHERIFTPNFTTKTTGMGLGLAMVKQIVDSHGGSISFETETNNGTQFEIRLPKL
jgi:two-component system, NtrC family, nitrogen regulation sensor histidine kinase NtrY